MKLALCVLIAILTSINSAQASLQPASLFTDNAVLQRQLPIPVWGTANPGEPITVAIATDLSSTVAGPDGKWSVKLKALEAGGPYTLTVMGSGTDKVTYSNVMIGEVWVCSGQSNMEFGIRMADGGKEAMAAANNPNIRLFTVPPVTAFKPQSVCGGKWETCSPESLATQGVWGGFSAVAYYFARDLQASLKVPIGVIQASKGGTRAASWTSREALASNASLKYYTDQLDASINVYGDALKGPQPSKEKLAALYTEAKAKYDTDAAPIQAKFDTDLAAMKAKHQADVDAAKLAGSPLPSDPVYPKWPPLPVPPFDFSKRAMHTQLFNGIINPLIPYGIRGVIWYQGESNAGLNLAGGGGLSWEYKTLLPTLIADWRGRWGEGDFPFYLVQLPPFGPMGSDAKPSAWAELREAQRLTSEATPNTALAVITDLGDQKNVHPTRKEQVGQRIALIARARIYGQTMEYSGPAYHSVKIEGGSIRVSFTHADGLKAGTVTDSDGTVIASPDTLVGFSVAGADQVYHKAMATIQGRDIVVSSPDVPSPVAVRYGWANYPVTNLQNAAGLWASPFKSDDWAWSTKRNHSF